MYYCADRSAPYRADGSVAIPLNTILSVPDSKVKVLVAGAPMTMYHSLYAGST